MFDFFVTIFSKIITFTASIIIATGLISVPTILEIPIEAPTAQEVSEVQESAIDQEPEAKKIEEEEKAKEAKIQAQREAEKRTQKKAIKQAQEELRLAEKEAKRQEESRIQEELNRKAEAERIAEEEALKIIEKAERTWQIDWLNRTIDLLEEKINVSEQAIQEQTDTYNTYKDNAIRIYNRSKDNIERDCSWTIDDIELELSYEVSMGIRADQEKIRYLNTELERAKKLCTDSLSNLSEDHQSNLQYYKRNLDRDISIYQNEIEENKNKLEEYQQELNQLKNL